MLVRRTRPTPPAPKLSEQELESRIKQQHAQRLRFLHTVNKHKFLLEGSPLGDFEAWMESPGTLPLVIRGIAGRFRPSGNWEAS